jgi:phage-related protein
VPKTEVIIFCEDDGAAPLLVWLDGLQEKVQSKIIVRLERLAECGHKLRRPEADFLRDDIYELRIAHRRTNYRILYFFHAQSAVLSHGITKEARVPPSEIERAIQTRAKFIKNPGVHTYRE